MKYSSILSIIIFFFFSVGLMAQDTLQRISIKNPSFEDSLGGYTRGWTDCGDPGETPFDLHETNHTIFRVKEAAFDGRFFVGFVARDNGTTEGFSQKLASPMKKGKFYSFSTMLCRPKQLRSVSRMYANLVNYNRPVKLAIYGSYKTCNKQELLGVTELVEATDWLQYDFVLSPSNDYNYLIFRVVHDDERLVQHYNGALLMDDLSDIVEVADIDSAKKMVESKRAGRKQIAKIISERLKNEVLPEVAIIDSNVVAVRDYSFEGTGWVNCDKDEVLADKWSVRDYIEDMPTNAYDGEKFIGLVAKRSLKSASITQKIGQPLKKGVTYTFSAYLQRPVHFIHDGGNFIRKIRLGVYGGKDCDSMDLLATSPVLSNKEWKEYTFYITPKKDCDFIRLKALHINGKRYNGGLLIDFLSDFVKVE